MGTRAKKWVLAAFVASVLIHLVVLGLPGWELPDLSEQDGGRIDVSLVAKPVAAPPTPRPALKPPPPERAAPLPTPARKPLPGSPGTAPATPSAPLPVASEPASSAEVGAPEPRAAPKEVPQAPLRASGPEWPRGGRILYDVFYGRRDFLIGRTEHIWEQDGRRYRMTSLVETVGLTALLHSLRYAQHSEGQVTAHGLQPERFWVDQTGKGEEYAEFDWEAREATIHRQRGAPRHRALAVGDQDVLSIWHQLALLGDPPPHLRLTLVSNKAATPAVIEAVGVDQLDLPLGHVEAHHLRARAEDGSLTLELWLAEKFGYLPVRIVVIDRDGDTFDQRARSIELDPPPASGHSSQSPQ